MVILPIKPGGIKESTMIRRLLSIAVVLGAMLAAGGSAGCDQEFIERAARDSLVGFAENVFSIALEETVYPGGG